MGPERRGPLQLGPIRWRENLKFLDEWHRKMTAANRGPALGPQEAATVKALNIDKIGDLAQSLRETKDRLKDYMEWHEAAIPPSERDDYETDYLLDGGRLLVEEAERILTEAGG